MTQQNHDEEEIKALLKRAFPIAETELRRDLWPTMLQRLSASSVTVPWYDWALIAGLAGALIIFPKFVFFFAYHL